MRNIYFISLFAFFILTRLLQSCQRGDSSPIGCTDRPQSTLTNDRVEEIQLTAKPTTKSGHSSPVQPLGYKFTAKTGQIIKYQIDNPKVCAWLYDPNGNFVKETTLTKDGIYLLQLAQSEGTGAFNLTVTRSLPSPNTNQTSINFASTVEQPSKLTKEDAQNLIEKWLAAKNNIFGSSYSKSAGEQLITDLAYQRQIQSTVEGEKSALEYLRSSDMYYTYENQKVEEIIEIHQIDLKRSSVRAAITEKRTLHDPRRSKKMTSASYRASNCYEFENVNGKWKIAKTPDLIKDCGSTLDFKKVSPQTVVDKYYQDINSRQYKSAWNRLPKSLQEERQLHPQGYQSFVDFYDKLDGVRAIDLALLSENDSSAEVKADLQCKLKNGNISPLFLRFHLQKELSNREWKINKIQFDPYKKSTCGMP